jgi:hypothetical protein
MTKQTQQLVPMLVIGVLIGTSAVMVWKLKGGQTDVSVNESARSTPSGATTTLPIESNGAVITVSQSSWPLPPQIPANIRVGISVADQPAAAVVNVSGLSLSEVHWIGIYDDRDGHPGFIMGAKRVHPGDTLATVELLRPTALGGKYYAVILTDDGDDTFNRLQDLPPQSPDKVVMVSFLAR